MTDEALSSDEAEVEAVFERLRAELSGGAAGPARRHDGPRRPTGPALARSEAERFWAVTADRPFLYKPGAWGRARGLVLAPLKAVLRKLMRWYVEPAFAQQRDFNSRVLRAIDELSERIDAVSESLVVKTGELEASIDPVARSVERLERSLTEQDERLLHVERRTRRQGKAPAGLTASDAPSAPPAEEPDYFAFESRMRGSSELIRDRQSAYLDEFRDASPVLDIGCGRGEFVSLLREGGVEARGIDTNADMVEHCQDAGLPVEQADAISHLSGLDDGSLGGIFCAHVLEHLDPARIFQLLELAVAKLRPDAIFAAETPNPLSLVALSNFSADLSHKQPLHPETLSFLARQAGFRDVSVRFMSEPAEDERLRFVPLPEEPAFAEARRALDTDVNRLNEVVFGSQDYAVLART
jgi:O-antigen chain-terminating methyltransferase